MYCWGSRAWVVCIFIRFYGCCVCGIMCAPSRMSDTCPCIPYEYCFIPHEDSVSIGTGRNRIRWNTYQWYTKTVSEVEVVKLRQHTPTGRSFSCLFVRAGRLATDLCM